MTKQTESAERLYRLEDRKGGYLSGRARLAAC